ALAAAGGAVSVRVEGDVVQLADAPVERLLVLAGDRVPEVHLAVAVDAGEEAPRRVEGDGEKMRLAELVVRDQLERPQAREVEMRIGGPGRGPAIGRDGDRLDGATIVGAVELHRVPRRNLVAENVAGKGTTEDAIPLRGEQE